jgi:release factor glutamine methyltransferase
VLASGRARLLAAGIAPDEASVDVDLYACTILGWNRTRLLADRNHDSPPGLEPRFSDWIARRERLEPSAYIVGRREFWGLDFEVSPSVLIPRPETEFIVEEALARVSGIAAPLVADVGTGSGCIAVSIAHSAPAATVVATDISADALVVASRNAARHGVDPRVSFVQTSYLDGVHGPFDAIVSNPPYVKDEARKHVSRAVIRFEPHVALFGGDDGLDGVRAVLDAAMTRLKPNGWVIFEFGLGQDDEVGTLVAGYDGLRMRDLKADLQGIPRTAVVQLESRDSSHDQ